MLLRYPREKREGDLATALADRVLVSMTDQFMPQWRYMGGRNLDVDYAAVRLAGDRVGGLRPLHVKVQLYERRTEGVTP